MAAVGTDTIPWATEMTFLVATRFRAGWVAGVACLLSVAYALAQPFTSSAGDIVVETIAQGLEHPWALAFLRHGRMLVTERPGRMRIA